MSILDNRLYFGSYPTIKNQKIGVITEIEGFYFSLKKGLRLYISVFDSKLKETAFRSFLKTEHYRHTRGFVRKYIRDLDYREQFKILPESEAVLKEKKCTKAFHISDLQKGIGYKESVLCADLKENCLPKDMNTCIERLSSESCPYAPKVTSKKINTFQRDICLTCEDVCKARGIAYCQYKRTRLIPVSEISRDFKKCPRKKHKKIESHHQLKLF